MRIFLVIFKCLPVIFTYLLSIFIPQITLFYLLSSEKNLEKVYCATVMIVDCGFFLGLFQKYLLLNLDLVTDIN